MIAISPASFLRHLLRVGVFLLIGPLTAGIGYEAWLLWSESQPPGFLAFVGRFVFVIFCAYALGWKAALAVGLTMALWCALVRSEAAALVASLAVGCAAGVWLVGLDLAIVSAKPDWHHAGLAAFASLFSMWVIQHDRYLRPT